MNMLSESDHENFHDKIAKLCFNQFNKLPKSGKPTENEWSILSCIVTEYSNNFKVVALGTGTKCIGQSSLSKDGDILNDSHAEVICRRVFLRYIYDCILNNDDSFVTYNPDAQAFSINNHKFHFFTTQVPCGDAAIFPKQHHEFFGELIIDDKQLGVAVKTTGNKKIKLDHNRDIFRTGAKCLETAKKQDSKEKGELYHVTGVVRTKPGRGDPTLSVSCSDKIAKWCHLGIQGALLTILLDGPIYFSSFTIAGGTPYNKKALQRALCERLENVNLSAPYGMKEIVFGQSNLSFQFSKTEHKSPCSSSIVWLDAEKSTSKQTEVAVDGRRQGVTKKQIKSTGALQISKIQLFKRFIRVIQQYNIRLVNINDLKKLTYKEAKLAAKKYQEAWLILKSSFKCWTVKSDNLLDFRS